MRNTDKSLERGQRVRATCRLTGATFEGAFLMEGGRTVILSVGPEDGGPNVRRVIQLFKSLTDLETAS